jgi:hypothetical protein
MLNIKQPKKINFILIILIEAFIVSVLSFKLSLQWVVLPYLWFAISSFVFLNYTEQLNKLELKIFLTVVFGYLIFETAIKIIVADNILPDSYLLINLLEHFSWAACFSFVIYPIFKNDFKLIRSVFTKAFILIGTVNIIGVANEILEFVMRLNILNNTLYYPDTIRDLTMNLFGASVIFGIIYILDSQKNS